MNKNILHISHHIGCFRDQQYVLEKLNFSVTNYKFTDNLYTITKDVSKQFWDNNKEIFNEFDYILISDTAPLSRCFLEHINELKPNLIIWICNRFDWAMQSEPEYYELFKHTYKHEKIRVIPSTFFEKIWCLQFGIDILSIKTINPLGKISYKSESNIPTSKFYQNLYGEKNILPDADVIVPFYRNDNHFFKMSNFLKQKNFTVYNGTFNIPSEIKKYKAYVTLPDSFCKWFSFESIHENIPVILPSKKYLLHLAKFHHDYLFNITGYGGAELLTEDLIDLCEWYNPKFNSCRFYFNNFEEIPDIINNINKYDFSKESAEHENDILNKWKQIYNSF